MWIHLHLIWGNSYLADTIIWIYECDSLIRDVCWSTWHLLKKYIKVWKECVFLFSTFLISHFNFEWEGVKSSSHHKIQTRRLDSLCRSLLWCAGLHFPWNCQFAPLHSLCMCILNITFQALIVASLLVKVALRVKSQISSSVIIPHVTASPPANHLSCGQASSCFLPVNYSRSSYPLFRNCWLRLKLCFWLLPP